jgi:hypothetical protein
MGSTPFLVYATLHSIVGDKLKSKVIPFLEAKKYYQPIIICRLKNLTRS